MAKLSISKDIFNDKYYPMLFDYNHRKEVYKGSAGSGKSHFIAQKLILKGLKSKRRILVCRKYGVTLKNTVYQLFKEMLESFQLEPFCKVIENEITLPNGSKFIFCGLDEETKLLSLQNISDIFVEECYEVEKDIIEQLDLRLRGKAPNKQIFMAFNPISSKHWLYNYCEVEPPTSFYYSQSTYKDNKFLEKEYIEMLEDMAKRNPKKAKVFVYGEWGVLVDDVVLRNHSIQEFDYKDLLKDKHIIPRVGLDMGFVDPTAVVVSLYDAKNKRIYIIAEHYERGMSLSEIVQAIETLGVAKQKIWVDSADPRAIKAFKEEGIKAEGAKKGKDSVKVGISFLQDHEIIIHKSCVNFISNIENYVYLRDKKTNKLQEDKTDHEYSHAIDALRYAYAEIYSKNKLTTKKLDLF